MLSADRLVALACLVKAADVTARGPGQLPAALWLVSLLVWVAAAARLSLPPAPRRTGPTARRRWWAAVVVAGCALAADAPVELRRQHLVLLLGVAAAGAVARTDAEQLLLWRCQLSALYGFAALAKLNESFLAGNVLDAGVVAAPAYSALLPPPPLLLLLAAGGLLVLAEATLAVAPWRPRWRGPALGLALGVHVGALALTTSPWVGLRLVVFGGVAVVVCAASAGRLPVTSPAVARRPRLLTGERRPGRVPG